MAEETGRPARKPAPGARAPRRARGFTPAGALIARQIGTISARRGFAHARLAALWADIAGPEFAAVTRPARLVLARGPAGGLLTISVAGAHASQVQMMLPLLRERVNAALGPGAVGRIQIVHGAVVFAKPAAPPPPAAPVDLGPLREALSSIGDGHLRGALETLARNVLFRAAKSQEPGQ